MELKTKYKYVEFKVRESKNKIPFRYSYGCIENEHSCILGCIYYDNFLMVYVFYPEPDTTFSVDCLQDIIHFIGQLK